MSRSDTESVRIHATTAPSPDTAGFSSLSGDTLTFSREFVLKK
jgi:hypothetical protein